MTSVYLRADLVHQIVTLTVKNTDQPHQAASILCAAIALIWLATERGSAENADDQAMIEEFSGHLAAAVKSFRSDAISNPELLH